MFDEEWSWRMEVKRQKKQHQLPRMIVGTLSSSWSAKVKAATAPQSKPKSWHVFVGRLDPSITADDVNGYLKDASFVDIDVRSLAKKD